MKNALNIRTVMSRDALPVTESEQAVYALVHLTAGGVSLSEGMPANFGMVLDRSGSMDGTKMEQLKRAVGHIVDRLGEDDRISVTIFDDTVETLVPNQQVKDRASIKRKIDAISPRGGTQISDGLREGLQQVRAGMAPGRVNRILLLTDGRTWDDEAACLALAEEAAREGTAITSIGIGEEWNEKLLLEIADRSHGNSHWIQEPVAILGAFQQEVAGMRAAVLTNIAVGVYLNPEVRLAKIHRTVPMISEISGTTNGQAIALELGSLDISRGQSLLFDLRVPARQAGAFSLGRIEVSYDVPSQGMTGLRAGADLAVTFSNEANRRVNAEVMNLVERVSAFKLQTRALADIAAGDLDAATRRLSSAATVLLDLGEDELAAAATNEARQIARTGAMTSAGTKTLVYGTRKLTQAMTKTTGL